MRVLRPDRKVETGSFICAALEPILQVRIQAKHERWHKTATVSGGLVVPTRVKHTDQILSRNNPGHSIVIVHDDDYDTHKNE